ncbi:MAG TPA: SynChlorMet cassette protein ScmC [Syntrophales bacterium]|nr:SynChlorMet cassette protein ScmC [Syntrophales bacterium]HOX93347.1 SynChlorMet cassette protein ScmC [Syntrophales bacterium]HPI56548.1 SynChlorMet cassette protein ScmC [Syntrophales bacterium]HPN25031.1 SynChlorMet cassette protein ScmC [Syntrophales bacterium]HQM29226.1 SynChlorMet cassette protein ScmC [Syntrophales bacterium]
MIYTFELADGRRWGIRASEQTGPWAAKMARVMGMERSDKYYDGTLLLEQVGFDPSVGWAPRWRPPKGYPAEGWQVRLLPPGLEIWQHPDISETVCGLVMSRNTVFTAEQMRCCLLPLYEDTAGRAGLPLHAALMEFGGRGVLFAGRSGAGKTTACRRIPAPWTPLSDDTALVVRGEDGRYYAHAFPTWSAIRSGDENRTWNVSRSLHVAALFFIVQAGSDEVIPVGGGTASVLIDQASMMVFRSIMPTGQRELSPQLRRIIFNNAASLAAAIPSYILRLSLTGRFWEKIEEVLGQMKPPRCGYVREMVKRKDVEPRFDVCYPAPHRDSIF